MRIFLYIFAGFIIGVVSSAAVFYLTCYQVFYGTLANQAIDGCAVAAKIHQGKADELAAKIDSNMDQRIVFVNQMVHDPYRTLALIKIKSYVESHQIMLNEDNLKILARLPAQPPTQCVLRGVSNY